LTLATQFRFIDLFLAITVHLQVSHSHGTRVRFTVLVACSAELADHSCRLFCLQALTQPGGPREPCPPKFLKHIVICALRGGITNKIVLFAENQTFCPPPNFLYPALFGLATLLPAGASCQTCKRIVFVFIFIV